MTDETPKDQGPLDPTYNEPRVNQLITPGHANAARINETLSARNWKYLTAAAFTAVIGGVIWVSAASWVAKGTTEMLGGEVYNSPSFIESAQEGFSDYIHTVSLGYFGAPAPASSGSDSDNIQADESISQIETYAETAQNQVPTDSETKNIPSVSDIEPLVQQLKDVDIKKWSFSAEGGTFVTLNYLSQNGAINPVTQTPQGFLIVPSSESLVTSYEGSNLDADFLITGWAKNEAGDPVLVFGGVHDGEFYDLALTEADRLSDYDHYTLRELPKFLSQVPRSANKSSPFGDYTDSTAAYSDYMKAFRSLQIDPSKTDSVYPEKAVADAIKTMVDHLNRTGEITDQISHVTTDQATLRDFQGRTGLYDRMVIMQHPDSKDMIAAFPSLNEEEEVQVGFLMLKHSDLAEGYVPVLIDPAFEGESLDFNVATFGEYPVVSGYEAQSILMRWGLDAYRAQKNQ